MNVKLAGIEGAPRLQIANTGLSTGDANLIVFVPVKSPLSLRSSPTTLGEVVTVPPINELFGDQMLLVPLMTAPSNSPA